MEKFIPKDLLHSTVCQPEVNIGSLTSISQNHNTSYDASHLHGWPALLQGCVCAVLPVLIYFHELEYLCI